MLPANENISPKRLSWWYSNLDSSQITKQKKQLDSGYNQFVTPVYSSMFRLGIHYPLFRKYILFSELLAQGRGLFQRGVLERERRMEGRGRQRLVAG